LGQSGLRASDLALNEAWLQRRDVEHASLSEAEAEAARANVAARENTEHSFANVIARKSQEELIVRHKEQVLREQAQRVEKKEEEAREESFRKR
jgi:hypothetical protein